ncbi:MAG: hypothetical protein PVI30_20445 [Myxococcales bacterium]|jgi:hypothetical protein
MRAAWGLAWGLWLLSGTARADDWMAVLPGCAHDALPQVGAPMLVYPRAGLPAVVRAGDDLVARVRLPVALTPPPGIQQARALRGFRARLWGGAVPLGREVPVARVAVPVVDVRPDGPRSLVYRVRIPVPAWLAPGSYLLSLRVPGGQWLRSDALRVIEADAPVRMAWLPSPRPVLDAAFAAQPVDVWLAAAAVSARPSARATPHGIRAAPVLAVEGAVAALRVGGRLHVLGDCADRHLPFAGQITAALEEDGLRRAPLRGRPFAALEEGGLRVETVERGRVRLSLAASAAGPAEVPVRVLGAPDRVVDVDGSSASLSWHPATDPATAPPNGPVALLGRLRLSPGDSVTLRQRAVAPLPARLAVAPPVLPAGAKARLSLSDAPDGSWLGLRLDPRRTLWTPRAEVTLRRPGIHGLRGLALAPDGRVRAVRADVRVRPRRALVSCAVAGGRAGGAPSGGSWGGSWLWPGLILLKRRRRRRCGNRLGRSRRWTHGHDPIPPPPRSLSRCRSGGSLCGRLCPPEHPQHAGRRH